MSLTPTVEWKFFPIKYCAKIILLGLAMLDSKKFSSFLLQQYMDEPHVLAICLTYELSTMPSMVGITGVYDCGCLRQAVAGWVFISEGVHFRSLFLRWHYPL